MGNAKPWQIVLIVAAVVIAVGMSVYTFSGGDSIDVPDTLMLVDVETGKLYSASTRNGGVSVPAVSPESGRRSLVTVSKNEDGRWVANARELSILPSFKVEPKVVDSKTGEVRVSEDRPTPLKRGS